MGVPPAAGSPNKPTWRSSSAQGGDWLARAAMPAQRLLCAAGCDTPVKGFRGGHFPPTASACGIGKEQSPGLQLLQHPSLYPTGSTTEPGEFAKWSRQVRVKLSCAAESAWLVFLPNCWKWYRGLLWVWQLLCFKLFGFCFDYILHWVSLLIGRCIIKPKTLTAINNHQFSPSSATSVLFCLSLVGGFPFVKRDTRPHCSSLLCFSPACGDCREVQTYFWCNRQRINICIMFCTPEAVRLLDSECAGTQMVLDVLLQSWWFTL